MGRFSAIVAATHFHTKSESSEREDCQARSGGYVREDRVEKQPAGLYHSVKPVTAEGFFVTFGLDKLKRLPDTFIKSDPHYHIS